MTLLDRSGRRLSHQIGCLKSSASDTPSGSCQNIPELSSHALKQTTPSQLDTQVLREEVSDLVLHGRCSWVDTHGLSQVVDRQTRHGARGEWDCKSMGLRELRNYGSGICVYGVVGSLVVRSLMWNLFGKFLDAKTLSERAK